MTIRLRPLVYTANSFVRGSQNTSQQMFLLKALQVTDNPQELRRMIGVKTVAEVFRTLDKLAMRKEYHSALERNGVSFDFIVGGLKGEAIGAEKGGERIKAYQILLKSLGMDKYDVSDSGGGGTWEEELLKSINKEREKNLELPPVSNNTEYEVKTPVMPDSVKKMRQDEAELVEGIYE